MTALLALMLAATLTTGSNNTPHRPARPPSRPIVVHIAGPGHGWREISIGAAAGAGVVLLLLGGLLLTGRSQTTSRLVRNPTERNRR
jgi:hypothetical protein